MRTRYTFFNFEIFAHIIQRDKHYVYMESWIVNDFQERSPNALYFKLLFVWMHIVSKIIF